MTSYYEAEVIIGIEDIAIQELKTIPKLDHTSIKVIRQGFIRFQYDGIIQKLNKLHAVIAIYEIHHFDIPRPKALLGHEHFTRLVSILSEKIRAWSQPELTFGIGVAGSESSVIHRLKEEISKALDIIEAEDGKGSLYWRLIPAYKNTGWEVLIRLTPKPLSTRQWRINNIPGALNATVAYAMTQLTEQSNNHTVLNFCSGTATILIEYAQQHDNSILIAIDNDPTMIRAGQENLEEANVKDNINQIYCDATQSPIADNSIDCIYADLPFGHYIGSHDDNEWLYPAILNESARVAKQHTPFIVITHEIQLFEQSVTYSNWKIKSQRQINLNGLHPRIFVLELN